MNFSFSKKKIIFSSIFIVLFIFLFSPLPAHAAWYDFLIGAVTFIPNVAIALIFYLLVVLTSLLSAFAGVILKWVISPTFISLSYTKPGFNITAGENPIIATGLGITQGFVNMILVLILIYIALATILRLAGYETKKLLVTFVLVALLVNFSPVICGLIVDASNIVMNYFLKELTGGQQLINSLKSIVDVVTANFNWEVFKVTKQIDIMMYFLVLAVFNWFLALILMLFAAVFLIRYIAIWILVILSPLAFACYILPATKKYWTLWWTQFLQWSFIGAIAGFFLYLGEQVAALAPSISSPPGELGGAILPYLVPLAFLYLGLIVGFSTSAYGASAVIDMTKKSGKWVGGKTWQGAKTWAEEKGHTREAAGKAVHAVEKIPVARAFLPQKVREYGQFEPAIAKARAKGKFQSSLELAHRAATGTDYGVNAVGNLMEIVERGDSNDWIKTHARQYGIDPDKDKDYEKKLNAIPKYREKMARLIQIAQQGGQHNTILRSAPRLAEFAKIKGYEGLNRQQAMAKAIEEARPQHVNKWEEEDILDEDVIKPLMNRGRDMWQAVGQVKKGHIGPLKVIGGIYKKDFHDKGKTWEDFENSYKEQGKEGFFDYLSGDRAKEQGWTKERIMELATGQKIAPKVPPTPGEAVGIKVVTPIGAIKRTEEEIAEKKKIREEYVEKKGPRGRPGVGGLKVEIKIPSPKKEQEERPLQGPTQAPPGPPEAPEGYAGPGIREVPPKRPRGRGGVGV